MVQFSYSEVDTPATVCQILDEAQRLLDSPQRWTQNTMARDRHGCSVSCSTPLACRWCLLGALVCASWKVGLHGMIPPQLGKALLQAGGVSWNDSPDRTFDDVRALLAKWKQRFVQDGERSEQYPTREVSNA